MGTKKRSAPLKRSCDVNACPLICYLPELKDKPDFYSQKRDLVNTKVKFPKCQAIHAQVLQNCIERVEKAFSRWLKGDGNGKRLGKWLSSCRAKGNILPIAR